MSNGEHNELRAVGYTRPLSVLWIESEVNAKYSRMSAKKLVKMIAPIGKPYYTVHVLIDNFGISYVVRSSHTLVAEDDVSPVPQEILHEISHQLKNAISIENIVDRLRCKTVPSGYVYHKWREDLVHNIVNVCF